MYGSNSIREFWFWKLGFKSFVFEKIVLALNNETKTLNIPFLPPPVRLVLSVSIFVCVTAFQFQLCQFGVERRGLEAGAKRVWFECLHANEKQPSSWPICPRAFTALTHTNKNPEASCSLFHVWSIFFNQITSYIHAKGNSWTRGLWLWWWGMQTLMSLGCNFSFVNLLNELLANEKMISSVHWYEKTIAEIWNRCCWVYESNFLAVWAPQEKCHLPFSQCLLHLIPLSLYAFATKSHSLMAGNSNCVTVQTKGFREMKLEKCCQWCGWR